MESTHAGNLEAVSLKAKLDLIEEAQEMHWGKLHSLPQPRRLELTESVLPNMLVDDIPAEWQTALLKQEIQEMVMACQGETDDTATSVELWVKKVLPQGLAKI